MRKPLITLTTDFGSADHFVGTMKGVILRLCPQAAIVDISHEITPFEVAEAGFVIAQAYPYFPKKTVHVVVVDPGVGTLRRPILAEAAGQYFVAPDNGVLSMIYAREKHKVRAITTEKLFLQPLSQTFHGRDVFAPVAAHLARGLRPAQCGKLIQDYLRSEFDRPVRTGKRYWAGRILKIDRFGNLITNFPAAEFSVLERRPFEMTIGPHRIRRLVHSYAEGDYGELVLIAGSTGFFEVASNQASAAKITGCAVGTQAELAIW